MFVLFPDNYANSFALIKLMHYFSSTYRTVFKKDK
jgi:hypothetical protein